MIHLYQCSIFSATVCEDDPPSPPNGVLSSWDSSTKLTGTGFNYSCPDGQVFEGVLSQYLENYCFAEAEGVKPKWKFSSLNPIPPCLGRTFLSPIIHIHMHDFCFLIFKIF